ncbi:methyltransferase family protein [Paraburkholderia sp. BL6665CI2N2]|uniref:class I SAM-dependent methyltransferase n=1 Tax=Paraburkholderia sp. BL6665CI2N2 TaxID=1938806 RepID=UPI001066BBA4|nr:class I SAM-dependent methyltransferase [Paraburkholderia sp. BL6665CI2N2]TDY20478.1 methyltransferase family protein [Paraburkholderia sp. BL6665CI2N2]
MRETTGPSGEVTADLEESILLPQLGCPAGKIGVAVGAMLERSNHAVIMTSFDLLDLHANERVLEVGLGNGGHIAFVLDQAERLRFTGIDISPTMIAAARSRNAAFVRDGRVRLETADVVAMPFSTASFDKAVASNSTYFWPDLQAGLKEIRRVLRVEGTLVIAAITPEAAIEMPFAEYGFTVHDAAALEAACLAAGFDRIGITRYLEPLSDPPQERGPRAFYLLRACAV